MSESKLSLMLREAGFVPLEDDPETAAGAGFWILGTKDFRIYASHDPHRRRLVLSAGVGEPAPWRRNELFELILEYNNHCVETGVRLGLDETDDNVAIVMDLPLGWLANGGLARAFFTLLDLRATWQRIVDKDAELYRQAPPAASRGHYRHIHV